MLVVAAALLPATVANSAGVQRAGTVSRVANRGTPVQVGPLVTSLAKRVPTAEEVLVEINAARKQRGLAPVLWNPKIASAAQGQADYLASIGEVVHTGANGTTAGDRLSASGFVWTSYAEALAAGYEDAPRLVQGWLNSPRHRAVILGNYNYIGIGRGIDGANNTYWCAIVANGR